MTPKIAILYQANPSPSVGHSQKPMKSGGYRDSGADIGFALRGNLVPLMTPRTMPSPTDELDWVFPDSEDGIHTAFEAGAQVFWLNTILYDGHPIEKWFGRGLEFIGQTPHATQLADDKFSTNWELRNAGLAVAASILFSKGSPNPYTYPLVLKPVRGRGSQGVVVVRSESELIERFEALAASGLYGSEFILEEMLPGREITITVMPPGHYKIGGALVNQESFWALPPVLRFHHQDDVAPYNGIVAVSENSRALSDDEIKDPEVQKITRACEFAASLVDARAPIRIDCRQTLGGTYKIFDLNMKPNMTGAGRPGREKQDSLSAIAARAIGWSYSDLLMAIFNRRWKA